jgi:hypothetical protein
VREAIDQYKAAMSADAITITARVVGDEKPALVSVDLSRVSSRPGAQETIMYDDGLHSDGAAGDGVYGVTVGLQPDALRNNYADWRRPMPGGVALTVTAVPGGALDKKAGRRLSGAVGVLCVLARPETRTYWRVDPIRDWKDAQGLDQPPAIDESQPHPDKLFLRSLMFGVKDTPWSLPLNDAPTPENFLGYWCLSFWVRTDRATGKDITVNLRDSFEDSLPTDGPKVSLIKDGMIEGGVIDTTWRRVTIPIFLKKGLIGNGMVPTAVGEVVLSGSTASPSAVSSGPNGSPPSGEGDAEASSIFISDMTLYLTQKEWLDAVKAKGAAK